MKNTAFIIGLFLMTSCFAQKISKLYEETFESVVLIRTMRFEVKGDLELKSTIGSEGVGSGFIVSREGEIITAAHVVHTADYLSVVFSDGEEVPAQVVHSYPFSDLALIKLSSPKSTPIAVVKMGDSDKSKIGDQVFVIGAPFGLERSLSVGYISGKYNGEGHANGLLPLELLQTDAAINEGSSGSPMFNMKGEVIGVVSFILGYSKGFQALTFTATSNSVKRLLNGDQGIWIGIDIYVVSDLLAKILNLPQKSGVLVQNVAANSLGESMGLRGGYQMIIFEEEEIWVGGDIILAIESIELTDQENLMRAWQAMQALKSGDSLAFKVLRGGKILELQVTVP